MQVLIVGMGFSLHTSGEAKAERIRAVDNWGSYYTTHPQVMVGCIDEAMGKALPPTLQAWLTVYRKTINAIANDIKLLPSLGQR